MISFDLQGRTAVITGGFSGLGAHFAQVLADHGARVALLGRRIDLGREVAYALASRVDRQDDIRAYEADVTDTASVDNALSQTMADLGLPTIIVNNAGTSTHGLSTELSDEAWNSVMDVNLSGVFRVARAAGRMLIKSGQPGSIINIASILGLRVRPQLAPYAASKAAVVQLTKALALEWAEHGVRVNALAPGYLETDINRDLMRTPAGQALIARVPQKRMGRYADLDGALMLLASDASAYVTGTVITVDGGHLVSSL